MGLVNSAGESGEGMRNCAMCTMAAILGTTSGELKGMIHAKDEGDMALAAALGQADKTGLEQLNAVLPRMINLVQQASESKRQPLSGNQFGDAHNLKSATEVAEYAQSLPVGSKYAVWGCRASIMPGWGAHWNYAERHDDRVQFTDFQDAYKDGAVVATGEAFIQPRGESRDRRENYNAFIVLGFKPRIWTRATTPTGQRSQDLTIGSGAQRGNWTNATTPSGQRSQSGTIGSEAQRGKNGRVT